MTAAVDQAKLKVQSFLTKLGNAQLDADGDLSFREGSTRVFVRVEPFGDDQAFVEVFAPVLFKVPPSAELYEYIATNNDFRFGKLRAFVGEQGVGIELRHTLLATFLDPDELNMAVVWLAQTADQLDDELKPRFGGERFIED